MNTLHQSKWTHVSLSILILVLTASCAVGTPTRQDFSRKDLEEIVEDWRVRSNLPGLVVGISLPNRPEILIASGESNMEDHVTMKEDDQFRIASISKTFIAAEVLHLMADDKIKLDNPLNAYLSDIPHGDIVTIRNLLRHRSGYFDPIFDDPDFIPNAARDFGRRWTWMETLATTFQHDLYFEPGSQYRYSNANYLLLGLVIEEVTNRRLGDVLATDFFTPLQLGQTVYSTPELDYQKINLAHGYGDPLGDGLIDLSMVPQTAITSITTDTIISNASGLLRWSRALYGRDAKALGRTLQSQMLSFDASASYGLGVYRFDTPLGTAYGHDGATPGYLALMEYFPEQDAAFVILVNSDMPPANLSDLLGSILKVLYDTGMEKSISTWVKDLKSDDPSIRKNAVFALGHAGPSGEIAVPELIAILGSDTVPENRKEAALALGLLGRDSEQAREALNRALEDENQSVREAAGVALNVLK